MGLSEISSGQMSYYSTLTAEEKARMHPCKKAKWYKQLFIFSINHM